MPAPAVHIDFETRSPVDIKKTGADVYAEHPQTDIMCLCYAFGDGPVETWTPAEPLPPTDLFDALNNGATLWGHNVHFELLIWNHVGVRKYGWPKLDISQVDDTMAICHSLALPGSLDGASTALGLPIKKDAEGRRLMLKLSRPRKINEDGSIQWWEDPAELERLYAYCRTDVEVERLLHRKLPSLKASERRLWLLDWKINNRGVPIDLVSVRAAKRIVEQEARRSNAELRRLTDGAVPAGTNVPAIVAWLETRGIVTHSLTKADVLGLLKRDDLDADVRRVLEIRQEVGGKSSVKKLEAMLVCTSADGRARGLMTYHGANTGRWAGRRIQPHNLPRPWLKQPEIEWCLDMLRQEIGADAIELVYGSPTKAISSSLRGMIAAKSGKVLRAGDFSNDEGRVLAWMTGEHWKLDAFREIDAGRGKDLYLVAASGIFGQDISDEEDPRRQVGKVSELALGYQGAAGAYATMAAGYNINVESIYPLIWPTASEERREEAEFTWKQRGAASGMTHDAWVAAELVKIGWRAKHPATVAHWKDLEGAAFEAVQRPGIITQAGPFKYRVAGSFLFCLLPSGRALAYPYPRLVNRRMPWKDRDGKPVTKLCVSYMGVDGTSQSKQWGKIYTYGGKLAENNDQGVSRDLLRDALFRVDAAGYDIPMHVHDEVVAECDPGFQSLKQFLGLVAEVPVWAKGLPMFAKGWEGVRYRK